MRMPLRCFGPHRYRLVALRSILQGIARKGWPESQMQLAQLAILAAAAVVTAERGLLLVFVGLAGHTQTHAGHGLAPRLGDLRIAFFAALQARTFRRLAAGTLDRIGD